MRGPQKAEWRLCTWSIPDVVHRWSIGECWRSGSLLIHRWLLRYHQIKIALQDRSKTTFATEWGCFQYTMMPLGLKNTPVIFSRILVATFKEYIHKFLEVYLDDWTIFGLVKHHVASLRLMLDTCRWHQIALNLKKHTFLVPFGNLLGHVVCKQGLMVLRLQWYKFGSIAKC